MPTANGTATEIDSLIKGIENVLVPIAESAIFAACPALGFPIIKQITDGIVQGISNEATKIASLYASFAVDDIQVHSEDRSISQALQAVIAAEKSGDSVALQSALAAYQSATARLVSDDGSVDL